MGTHEHSSRIDCSHSHKLIVVQVWRMSSIVACGVSRGCTFGDASSRKGSGALYQQAAASANGAPKWEDDASVSACRGCNGNFSLVVRKHHCRHCGLIFCAQCCREKRPLPKFDYLKPVRVCRNCAQVSFPTRTHACVQLTYIHSYIANVHIHAYTRHHSYLQHSTGRYNRHSVQKNMYPHTLLTCTLLLLWGGSNL